MRTKKYGISISDYNKKLGYVDNWSLDRTTCPFICPGCYAGKGNHNRTNVVKARFDNTKFIKICEMGGEPEIIVKPKKKRKKKDDNIDVSMSEVKNEDVQNSELENLDIESAYTDTSEEEIENKSPNYTPFIEEMSDFLSSIHHRSGDMFRIHEAGDFFSVPYAQAWYDIAKKFPHITFNAYTKQFDVIREVPFYKLKNFNLFLSAWPGKELPQDLTEHYRIAWLKDNKGIENRIPKKAFMCPGNKIPCQICRYCWRPHNKLKLDVVFREH